MFETLGGGYTKIGQVLSTRTDILPFEFTEPLQRLQDDVAPFCSAKALIIIEKSLALPVESLFFSFVSQPIGSASIAQVHRAVLRSTGQEVAVKIRRPGIELAIPSDSRLLSILIRSISVLPAIQGIPLYEAVQEVIASIQAQISLSSEANYHQKFFALFEHSVSVKVPRLHEEFCTDEVLVMEYFPQLEKITASGLDEEKRRGAVVAGLRATYKMLFIAGLVHCDMHPGNILVDPTGKVVLLDFGFSAVMPEWERIAFRDFFLSIALNDGETAARIVLQTATRIPSNLNKISFIKEISRLVDKSSGVKAKEFLICPFVASLFKIQRDHHVHGSSSFTLAILSLVVYEGIIRECYPDLDFQREAMQILLS